MITCEDLNIELCPACKYHIGRCWINDYKIRFEMNYFSINEIISYYKLLQKSTYNNPSFYFYKAIEIINPRIAKLMVLI